MQKSKIIIITFLCLFVTCFLFSQEKNTQAQANTGFRSGLSNISFVPPVVLVGDRVELRYEIESPGVNISTEFKSPDFIPKSEAFEIETVKFNRDSGLVLIVLVFRPWVQRALIIPSFTVNKIRVPESTLQVQSALPSKNTTLRESKNPTELPGTSFVLFVSLAIFALFVIFLIFIFSFILPHIYSAIRKAQMLKPRRQFLKACNKLEKKLNDITVYEFYTRLIKITRSFLAFTVSDEFLGYSASEMALLLEEYSTNIPCFLELVAFFNRADNVRFANVEIEKAQAQKDLFFCKNLSSIIEADVYD